MLATTPAPTVRPPSRMAKRSCSSMAIGVISSTSIVDVVAGHDHLGAFLQLHDAGHVGRAEVELRAVVGEERRVAAALFLGQDVGLGLELGVRRDRAGLASTWPRSTSSRLVPRSSTPMLSPAWPWSSSLRNISTPVTTVFCVGADADDLDFLADLDRRRARSGRSPPCRGRRSRTRLPPASGTAGRSRAPAAGCRLSTASISSRIGLLADLRIAVLPARTAPSP